MVSIELIHEMFDMVPDGRYAACLDESNDDYRFFRFAERKSGIYHNCRTIQLQASDSWLLVGYASAAGLFTWARLFKEFEHFKTVLCNPHESAYLYGEKLGDCCICGRTLTDPRSRALKIGPDCEKDHPDFLAYALSRLPDGPHSWESSSASSLPPLRITIPDSTLLRPPSRPMKL